MQSDCVSETGAIYLDAFTVTVRPTSVRNKEQREVVNNKTGRRLMEEYTERWSRESWVCGMCAGWVGKR